jgi:hypothetical protein
LTYVIPYDADCDARNKTRKKTMVLMSGKAKVVLVHAVKAEEGAEL